ncbi:uncharacterized protein LOC113018497 isoform X2 [Astatotilapia calliptera]|uniref:uncharacterized protein LOC113018497 isoform X2 n=1 Tax=Astatotilapia calliptera TaxID=8154 RepID=UPI000E4055E7|nr:uncharacterized protein LOC113018497 isoform X2 [Astatotilapia calliptera]
MSKEKYRRNCFRAAAPQGLAEMGKKLQDTKSVVKRQEEELNSIKESLADMEKKLQDAKSVVKRQELELNPVKESLGEMEAFSKVSLQKAGLAPMEEFYKDKLQQERSAHKETEEELRSFKDRVAGEIDLALKTGKSENMNNPVNETRLKEMYEELRKDWTKIKTYLQIAYSNTEQIKASIQRNFQNGAEEIQTKKKQIESAFNLHADNTPAYQKVHEYTKLTIQNLQSAVYYRFKDTAQGFHGQEDETRDAILNNLLSKCRWLSGLMALNNPPLQPDWINHHPGMSSILSSFSHPDWLRQMAAPP